MEGKLSNPQLKDAQKDLAGASLGVQNYIAAVTMQPDIILSELPKLPSHQQTARAHAAVWNSDILPGVINTITDVIDFANRFSSYYDNLVKLADKVATDSNAKENFIIGLTQLRRSVSEKTNNTKYTLLKLQSFQKDLLSDYKLFLNDQEIATKLYEAKGGEIQTLSKEIEEKTNQVNAGIGALVGGVIGTITGIVVIIVGVVIAVATEGAASPVILVGIGITVAGGATTLGSSVDVGL